MVRVESEINFQMLALALAMVASDAKATHKPKVSPIAAVGHAHMPTMAHNVCPYFYEPFSPFESVGMYHIISNPQEYYGNIGYNGYGGNNGYGYFGNNGYANGYAKRDVVPQSAHVGPLCVD